MAQNVYGQVRVGVRTFVGTPAPSNGTLTTAWISATGETDATIIGALNTLETNLNTYGLTSKMKALYPFVGGTAAKHKFNFMNAQDTDAAFRLIFNGGWTHSSTGALPNGTNGYADSYYNLSTQSTTSNISAGFYSRVNGTVAGADFGGADSSDNGTQLFLKYSNNITYWPINDYGYAGSGNIISNTQGLFVLNKVSTAEKRIYKNGSQIATAVPINNTAPNQNIIIGARRLGNNAVDQFSNREHSFTFFGDTLTDTEVSNLYTTVQAFQTTLGRQV